MPMLQSKRGWRVVLLKNTRQLSKLLCQDPRLGLVRLGKLVVVQGVEPVRDHGIGAAPTHATNVSLERGVDSMQLGQRV